MAQRLIEVHLLSLAVSLCFLLIFSLGSIDANWSILSSHGFACLLSGHLSSRQIIYKDVRSIDARSNVCKDQSTSPVSTSMGLIDEKRFLSDYRTMCDGMWWSSWWFRGRIVLQFLHYIFLRGHSCCRCFERSRMDDVPSHQTSLSSSNPLALASDVHQCHYLVDLQSNRLCLRYSIVVDVLQSSILLDTRHPMARLWSLFDIFVHLWCQTCNSLCQVEQRKTWMRDGLVCVLVMETLEEKHVNSVASPCFVRMKSWLFIVDSSSL